MEKCKWEPWSLPPANNILGMEIRAKKLILALFLLQTGSDNHHPLFLSVSRGEPRKAWLSCIMHAVNQCLPGFPDPVWPRVVSTEVAAGSGQEAQACAGQWAGWASCYHRTQHTQQHTNTALAALLPVLGCSACVGSCTCIQTYGKWPFSKEHF